MKTKNTFLGLALIGLIVGTAACGGEGIAPPAGTPDGGTVTAGSDAKADALQKEIDELNKQIEDLKNGAGNPAKDPDKPAPEAEVTADDIFGHWMAEEVLYVDSVSGKVKDAIADNGYVFEFTTGMDHTVAMSVTLPPNNVLPMIGSFTVQPGGILVLDNLYGPTGKEEAYRVSFEGDRMFWNSLPGQATQSYIWKRF